MKYIQVLVSKEDNNVPGSISVFSCPAKHYAFHLEIIVSKT